LPKKGIGEPPGIVENGGYGVCEESQVSDSPACSGSCMHSGLRIFFLGRKEICAIVSYRPLVLFPLPPNSRKRQATQRSCFYLVDFMTSTMGPPITQYQVRAQPTDFRHDDYAREKDVDVRAVVAETLRQRGFPPTNEDATMEES
jgi:hypothetical protein